jgi:hypothetical protein
MEGPILRQRSLAVAAGLILSLQRLLLLGLVLLLEQG